MIAASAQVGLGARAGYGLREAVQPLGAACRSWQGWYGADVAADAHRLAEEVTRFCKGIAQIAKSFVAPDEVEQIAILARRRILPATCIVANNFTKRLLPGVPCTSPAIQ